MRAEHARTLILSVVYEQELTQQNHVRVLYVLIAGVQRVEHLFLCL